jgi:nickel/cobalt transporter (NicO) family protein
MNEIWVLSATAASLGLVHTVLGPDHYLPFAAMARARHWAMPKTLWVTFLCGLGHIGSSVLLGLAGIALGTAVGKLEAVESFRGNLAAWAMIAFGLVYGVWGLRQAFRGRPHTHEHLHGDGTGHDHQHAHADGHLHVHDGAQPASITPWVLFTVFVFGPCEPLIPLLMYPAAKHSIHGMLLVTGVFGAVTIGTMLAIVAATVLGLRRVPLGRLERYSHALAGASIFLCGAAVQFLGL